MDRKVGLSAAFSVVAFVILLAGLIVLHLCIPGVKEPPGVKDRTFEIQSTDIVVAILPVIIYLLVTGKIQALEVGGLKVKTAIVNASNSAIESQVARLTEPIQMDLKAGVEQIPELIRKKSQGLELILGTGGYYQGSVIQAYLVSLTKQPFLQYIIIEYPDKTFFGIADARALADQLEAQTAPQTGAQTSTQTVAQHFTAETLAMRLNSTNGSDWKELKSLPGFISSDKAVRNETGKDEALRVMESQGVDTLPVVGNDRHFAGIVSQSRLTASLILDVAKQLKT
jgi:hypothetical protein